MNPLPERFFSWLIHSSWEASFVVVLVLGAQYLFKHRLPARWRHALWLLVLLRLVLPTLPPSPLGIHRIPQAAAAMGSQQAARALSHFSAPVAPNKPGQSAPASPQRESSFRRLIQHPSVYAFLWLTGALGFTLATLASIGRLAFTLRKSRPCQTASVLAIARAAATELGLRHEVRIVTTSSLSGPAVAGIFRPALLIPEGLPAAFSAEELRIVFLHEFAHLRRGDVILNAALVVLQILHWFNPILWFAFARMRHDRELATDALVLAEPRTSLKTLYGHTLLKLIEGFDATMMPSPRLVGIMESPRDIKDRLTRITQATPGAYRRSLLGLALIALIGSITLPQGKADPTPRPAKTPSDFEKTTDWYLAGTQLDPGAVASLEKQVAAQPDNLEARTKILGFYNGKRILQEPARAAAQPHILWIIRNRPDSAAAGQIEAQIIQHVDPARYEEARNAWIEQTAKHPGNAQILGNAAAFFLLNDAPLAEKLLRQAQALEPKNPEWSERLGHLFALKGMENGAPAAAENNRKALAFYEAALPGKQAQGDKKGDLRFYRLPTIAQAALDAGEHAKARAYAEELLVMAPGFKGDWNYGNAIYTGNTILGLIALSQNDLPAARNYLLAAGETPGSPQLDSFGPDLTLAQKLLEQGEKEAVTTFLGRISKFWKGHETQIKEWQEAIRQGKVPSLNRWTPGR